MSNVTWPWSSLPETTDFNVGISAPVQNWQRAGAYYGINVTATHISTGEVLWEDTIYESQYSGHTDIADHGKISTLTLNTGFHAWDLETGVKAWVS